MFYAILSMKQKDINKSITIRAPEMEDERLRRCLGSLFIGFFAIVGCD